MDWYPLRLSFRVRLLVFGGRAIAERLRKEGLPDWPVAETWDVSDVDGYVAEIRDGPLAGMSLRQLVRDHPEEVMGRGWRGDRFPVLTKFIDASGTLPVHVHADDAAARQLEGEPNGKTEAWHILDAAAGATALCGVKPGVTEGQLRQALLDEDFDAVLRRLPSAPGRPSTCRAVRRTASGPAPWSTRSSRPPTSAGTPCAGTWKTDHRSPTMSGTPTWTC
jgi:mannose-6-phosphate isomerase class I